MGLDYADQRFSLPLVELNMIKFAQPLRPLQNFSGLAAVRGTDDSVAMHHIQDAGRPAITEPEPEFDTPVWPTLIV